ncbi:hypothetical protein GCM10028862_18150 [Luteimonas pelagia]
MSGAPARADTKEHTFSATAACHPMSALNAAGIRHRPMGIFNAKPVGVFISCSFYTDPLGDVGKDRLEISFFNGNGEPVTVGCTAQGGSRVTGVNNYSSDVSVPPGTSAQLVFEGIHRRRDYRSHINLSCLLPSGVEMGRITMGQRAIANDL